MNTNSEKHSWPIYTHLKLVQKCEDEKAAKAYVDMWNCLIDSAKINQLVYVRLAPHYYEDRNFKGDTTWWVAVARVSFGPRENYKGKET